MLVFSCFQVVYSLPNRPVRPCGVGATSLGLPSLNASHSAWHTAGHRSMVVAEQTLDSEAGHWHPVLALPANPLWHPGEAVLSSLALVSSSVKWGGQEGMAY